MGGKGGTKRGQIQCFVVVQWGEHFLYIFASSKQHSMLRLPSYFYYRQYAKI